METLIRSDLRQWMRLIEANSTDSQSNGFDLKMYHGTNKVFDRFLPFSHFGTEAQARMRQPKHILPVYIRAKKFKRMRDTGDWRVSKLRALQRQGYDGVVYLNRYEGIPLEQFDAAHAKVSQERLDKAPDTQYKRMIPAAEDSYIIFDPLNVRL